MNNALRGVLPTFLLTVVFGTLAIPAKALANYFTPFGQITTSLGITSVVILIFSFKTILREIKLFDKKELLLLILRSALYYLGGAILYLYAFHFSTIATVTFFQILPILSVFGILFFGEKISKTFVFVITSFLGSLLMLFQLGQSLQISLDKGALLSILSAICINLSFLLRKKHNSKISDITLSFGMAFFASLLTLLPAIYLGFEKFHIDRNYFFWQLSAIGLNLGVVFFTSAAFRHVKAQTAGVILTLEPLVAALLAYLVFGEMLTSQQFLGALVIFVSVVSLAIFSKD